MAGKIMRFIYLILICFAAPVAASIAWLRGLREPARRERLADRFGRPNLSMRAPTFWVHAASMGEVQASAVLVRRLLAHYPDHEIVMTTMTTTGAARVKALFPERVAHCYLPYDLPFAASGFLKRVQPRVALVLETELWPNLLNECRRRGIPVVIASARISPRTASRYRRFRKLFRTALQSAAVAAQTAGDAERFVELGAQHVQVAGNLKFDIDIAETVLQGAAALRALFGNRFVWVAGSTHEGEEKAVIAAHRQLLRERRDALLILVPRHPQRFAEVRTLLANEGIVFVTRSSGAPVTNNVAIFLVDTTGELLHCYAAADLAFVGGSLVPVGGHNLLEPAALGVATLCGPYMSNAQEITDRLLQTEGVKQVSSTEALAAEVLRLAVDKEARRTLGDNARQVVQNNRGAVDRVIDAVARIGHASSAH